MYVQPNGICSPDSSAAWQLRKRRTANATSLPPWKVENCQPTEHSDSSPSYCILMTPAKITQSCPLQLLKIDECHLNLTVAAGGSSAQAKVLTVSEVLMNFM